MNSLSVGFFMWRVVSARRLRKEILRSSSQAATWSYLSIAIQRKKNKFCALSQDTSELTSFDLNPFKAQNGDKRQGYYQFYKLLVQVDMEIKPRSSNCKTNTL